MISIREVAKLAGVSPATVSRVMNGTAHVSESKKERVLAVIQETGFKPNEVARMLYKKRSNLIGLIVPNIENPYFSEMAASIEEAAYARGFSLTLCSSNDDEEKELSNIDLLSRMNADGILLLTNSEELLKKAGDIHVPIVLLDREVHHESAVACLQSDNYQGGRLAVSYLLECGCRQPVCIRGPQDVSSGRERFRGYMDVCAEQGIEPLYLGDTYDYKNGLEIAEVLLDRYPEADGIIAANDMVALSVYNILTKRNIKVPEDIQLIGFDNIRLSGLVTPGITTVAQPIGQMGADAAKLIIDHLEEKEISRKNIYPVSIVERETTRRRK